MSIMKGLELQAFCILKTPRLPTRGSKDRRRIQSFPGGIVPKNATNIILFLK